MTIKKPSDCTKEELESFENLVLLGGQVDPIGLQTRIKNCKLLGFYYSGNNELIGISAIKQKNKVSVERIKNKAKVSDNEIPTVELGYSVTKVEFRGKGINKEINDVLLENVQDEKIYATTDNDTMRKYLIDKGFTKKGKSFKGTYNENLDYFQK
jgi:RimJ/RimL family protein N-acetyltransferase